MYHAVYQNHIVICLFPCKTYSLHIQTEKQVSIGWCTQSWHMRNKDVSQRSHSLLKCFAISFQGWWSKIRSWFQTVYNLTPLSKPFGNDMKWSSLSNILRWLVGSPNETNVPFVHWIKGSPISSSPRVEVADQVGLDIPVLWSKSRWVWNRAH